MADPCDEGNNQMTGFRVAVVGTGFIGPVHVEALRRAGQHPVGILGSSAEKSRVAADRLGLETGFSSFEEILRDRHVDAVHLTTPNRWHFDMASRLLQAGKHVMCEKPLAMNANESAELVRRAADSGLGTAVTYNTRYYPLCREARERIAAGKIGDVWHVTGAYVQDWLLNDTDFNWRVLAAEGGELRAVADIGTHWLDLLQHLAGQPVVAVCADLQTVHPIRKRPLGNVETFSGKLGTSSNTEPISIDTEDAGFILLRFLNGAKGSLCVSQVTAGRKNCLRFEIAGSLQSLAWDSERPNEMWMGNRAAANEMLVRDPALLSPAARSITSYPGGHNEGFADTFKQLFREFYGYVAASDWNAARSYPTFLDGHREIVLCEAILRSHREQRWVELPQA